MAASDPFQGVVAHYGATDLTPPILEALRAAGKDLDALTADDVAPFTHLTWSAKVATVELGRLAGLQARMHVLDLGSGLGGPARTLATEFGCRVTGLDLTDAFVRTATDLTARVGLADQVSFHCGNALELPFPDASFDVVWHEQFAMHVADKERLYHQVHRVLRPGGRLAMREFLAGAVEPLHFPVPWALQPGTTFLWSAEAVRDLLTRLGFRELAWDDLTGNELMRRPDAPAPAGGGPPPGFGGGQLFLSSLDTDVRLIQQSLRRNFGEDRLRIVQAVYQRD